jgi:hypothetical protein
MDDPLLVSRDSSDPALRLPDPREATEAGVICWGLLRLEIISSGCLEYEWRGDSMHDEVRLPHAQPDLLHCRMPQSRVFNSSAF